MNRLILGGIAAGILSLGSLGAEAQEDRGLGRAALPEASYSSDTGAGSLGLQLGLGWARPSWDIGPASGSENVFAPKGSLFYKATDNLDVNFSVLYVKGSERDDDFGKHEAEMLRLAVGTRYWLMLNPRVTPYAGVGIGYYMLDGSLETTLDADGNIVEARLGSVKDAPGAFVEAGTAFQIMDNFYLNADLSFDFLLSSSNVSINGRKEDLKMRALALTLSASFLF